MSTERVNVAIGGPKNPSDCTYKTVILKSNISFASQIGEENTKYVIKWNYDLGGQTVEIPAGCILDFDGGVLSNGTLVGLDTYLVGDKSMGDNITSSVTLEGTWKHNAVVGVDSELSQTSTNPVENKVVTEALGGKVDKEGGKGLSSNDYSNADKDKVEGMFIAINNKVDKAEGKDLSTNDYTDEEKEKLYNIEEWANANVNPDWNEENPRSYAFIKHKPDLTTKVDKEEGKGLSTNDFTNEDKAKLDNIPTVDNALSNTSINPVQNKVITEALGGFYTKEEVDGKIEDADDVYDQVTRFPYPGNPNKIYISKANGLMYVWRDNGTPEGTYQQVGGNLDSATIEKVNEMIALIWPDDDDPDVDIITEILARLDALENAQPSPSPEPEPEPEPEEGFKVTKEAKYAKLTSLFESTGLVDFGSNAEHPTAQQIALDTYCREYYNEAYNQFISNSSILFDRSYYPEIEDFDTIEGLRGTNTSTYELAFDKMAGWLMAMCLAELKPTKNLVGVRTEQINNQTVFFQMGYAFNSQKESCVDALNGRSVALYDNYAIHCDPMIARLAAAAVYVKVRSTKEYSEIESLRNSIGGVSISGVTLGTKWEDLETVFNKDKGQYLTSLGYLPNSDMIIPYAPGPYSKDGDVDNERYLVNYRSEIRQWPLEQGQVKDSNRNDLFCTDPGVAGYKNWWLYNYWVDIKVDAKVCETYRMSIPYYPKVAVTAEEIAAKAAGEAYANTQLNYWQSYNTDLNRKIAMLKAATAASATTNYWFSSKHVKPRAIEEITRGRDPENHNLPCTDDDFGYFRVAFEETAGNSFYNLAGPFSDLHNKVFIASGYPQLTDSINNITPPDPAVVNVNVYKFFQTILEFGDDSRFPSYVPEYRRRRRPLGGIPSKNVWRAESASIGTGNNSGKGYYKEYGDPLNGMSNHSLSILFADCEGSATVNDGVYKYETEHDNNGDPASSYPSGHASQTMEVALMLGQMFGDYPTIMKYIKNAYEVGTGRAITRHHWYSDIIYGRLFATMALPLINAMSGIMSGADSYYRTVRSAITGNAAPNYPAETVPAYRNISVAIVNNSGAAITLRREVRFVVGDGLSESKATNRVGISGAGNAITIPNDGKTYTLFENVELDELSASLLGRNFASSAQLQTAKKWDSANNVWETDSQITSNIVGYTDGNVMVPLVDMLSSVKFGNNTLYTINYGGTVSSDTVSTGAVRFKFHNGLDRQITVSKKIKLYFEPDPNLDYSQSANRIDIEFWVDTQNPSGNVTINADSDSPVFTCSNIEQASHWKSDYFGTKLADGTSLVNYLNTKGIDLFQVPSNIVVKCEDGAHSGQSYYYKCSPIESSDANVFRGDSLVTIYIESEDPNYDPLASPTYYSNIEGGSTSGGSSSASGSGEAQNSQNVRPTGVQRAIAPIISFNIRITNNKATAVTLRGDINFTLANPDKDGYYHGLLHGTEIYQGAYNRSGHQYFSGSSTNHVPVTIAAGASKTYTLVRPLLEGTTNEGLGGRNPLDPALLSRDRNVQLYDLNGNSSTILANNMDPETVFTEGATYDIVIPA